MPTTPLVSTDRAYLLDNAGDYIVADSTIPNGPLVRPNASLTSNARHVITRSGNTVVASSSSRDIYTRGGIGPLVTPRSSLIVQPVTGAIATTAFLTEGGYRLLTESGLYLSYP
jgi:hypothetical protein